MQTIHEAGLEILRTLESHGFAAVFVGGYVRDLLLGIPSSDIDIATSATPSDVKRLFERTKDTGVKYGTVTVFFREFTFEVTTFRTEQTYSDQRHPDRVDYATRLEDDLSRRDFTINALAMDKDGKILDFVGGRRDLDARLIRAIGNPESRFQEDALRILRAFRFVAKLDFDIESATLEAISRKRHLVRELPSERILSELKAMFSHPHTSQAVRAMMLAHLEDVFPEWREGLLQLADSEQTVRAETFFALSFLRSGGTIPERWRFSNREKTRIQKLMDLIEVTERDSFTPMLLYCYGLELCLEADQANGILHRRDSQAEWIRHLDATLPIRRPCDLAFKGDDILTLTGVKNARIIGQVIEEMIDRILTGEMENKRDVLSAYALTRIERLLEDEETL